MKFDTGSNVYEIAPNLKYSYDNIWFNKILYFSYMKVNDS